MRMDNGDEYLTALQDFAKAEEKQLTPELVDILEVIARTGKCLYNWEILKPFLAYILDEVTKDFLSSSDTKDTDDGSLEITRQSLIESFKEFKSAPFTLQRLAELLADPKKHYKSPAKYFRGLQKNIFVVSTIDVEHASVKSLKRQRDQVAEHKQNGTLDMCSPHKVRRIGTRIISHSSQNNDSEIMAVDVNEDNKTETNVTNDDNESIEQKNENEVLKDNNDKDNNEEEDKETMETSLETAAETMVTENNVVETKSNSDLDDDKENAQNCNGTAAMEED